MEEKIGRILAVDDNEDILFALKLLLRPHVEIIETLTGPENLPEVMHKQDWDVVLLDMNFTKDAISGQEGFDALSTILEIDPNAVVVFITAYGDAEKAVKSIKMGATDFILKPWQNEKILATINSAISLRRTRIQAQNLKMKQQEISAVLDQPYTDFVGQSPEMYEVFNTIKKVAATDANILILGENGTGKELVARALYRNSLRKDEVFISVDLGSIPETLFESELFGHEKGAFTDAHKMKQGRFEIASSGTLFLDEIGNLTYPLQSKLLTVLERREITRVGSTKPIPIDVRMICATNNNIHMDVAEGIFRQDLLYRINTVEIHLPPLRDRTGDVPLLADHFLKAEGGNATGGNISSRKATGRNTSSGNATGGNASSRKTTGGNTSRIPGKIWAGLILGSLVLIFGFVFDYSRHMLTHFSLLEMLQVKNPEVLEYATSYVPSRFPWEIFIPGEGLILITIGWYWRTVR